MIFAVTMSYGAYLFLVGDFRVSPIIAAALAVVCFLYFFSSEHEPLGISSEIPLSVIRGLEIANKNRSNSLVFLGCKSGNPSMVGW